MSRSATPKLPAVKSKKMPLTHERRFDVQPLPYFADLEHFGPAYTPEKFTDEQKYYLEPFFTNLDRPVFIATNLPEEVIGALCSRYSRSTHSLRQMLWREYLKPVLYPEQEKDWNAIADSKKRQAFHVQSRQMRQDLKAYIKFLHKPQGKLDKLVNVQRGRKFFTKWLNGYGDDSIEELGGIHLCSEGVSSLALEEAVNKRVGISLLVKSSRYVSFSDRRPDGQYQFHIPGEIKGTALEKKYIQTMEQLFATYTEISEPYLEYIKTRYPQEADETEGAFNGSRGAKRFDDIRDLLPFATQNNVAMYGNGRAFEDLVTRLINHPIGENRWWGQAIAHEMSLVVPSFVERPQSERGARVQLYRSNLMVNRNELANELTNDTSKAFEPGHWATLVKFDPDAEVDVLTAELFGAGDNQLSYGEIKKIAQKWSPKKRAALLGQILNERLVGDPNAKREGIRFNKVPRSFETAIYGFDVWGKGGDYRDLHRHRQNTELHPNFSTRFGYGLEVEVAESPFVAKFRAALTVAEKTYLQIAKKMPEIAQYVVPFGYFQNWFMQMSAREVYWMVELRTGPQGRPHYRDICTQIADAAIAATPSIFQAIQIDRGDYTLARRESEKKAAKKLQQLES